VVSSASCFSSSAALWTAQVHGLAVHEIVTGGDLGAVHVAEDRLGADVPADLARMPAVREPAERRERRESIMGVRR
jgi:hypothetical protein